MRGDHVSFKINSRQPASNRIERDYDLQPIEYRSYNENKTVRLLLRGLKETYRIKLYDWTATDIAAFNAIETPTVKNLCTFQPTLDKAETKQCYFEYWIDPFKKVLNIELTPVFLLNYSVLNSDVSYSRPVQNFGNTTELAPAIIGTVQLPTRTTVKISVNYDTTEKISITGKIHREYFYKSGYGIYKKIKFTGISTGITNDLYNSLRVYQGVNNTVFSVDGSFYQVAPVLKFMQILKDTWILDFSLEVQEEFEPETLFFLGDFITPPVDVPDTLFFLGNDPDAPITLVAVSPVADSVLSTSYTDGTLQNATFSIRYGDTVSPDSMDAYLSVIGGLIKKSTDSVYQDSIKLDQTFDEKSLTVNCRFLAADDSSEYSTLMLRAYKSDSQAVIAFRYKTVPKAVITLPNRRLSETPKTTAITFNFGFITNWAISCNNGSVSPDFFWKTETETAQTVTFSGDSGYVGTYTATITATDAFGVFGSVVLAVVQYTVLDNI